LEHILLSKEEAKELEEAWKKIAEVQRIIIEANKAFRLTEGNNTLQHASKDSKNRKLKNRSTSSLKPNNNYQSTRN